MAGPVARGERRDGRKPPSGLVSISPFHLCLFGERGGISMTKWSALFWAVSASVALAAFGAPSAQALTMKECSAKYKAAQQAGSLNGMSWTDFRKAECSSAATAATPAAGSKTAPAATSGTAA